MIFLLVVKNKQLFSMKHPTITFICSKIERKPISKFKTVRSAPPAPLIGKRHRVTCSKDASCRTRRVITPRHVRVTSRHLVTHGNIRRRIRIYRVRAAQPTDLDWDESTSHAMPKSWQDENTIVINKGIKDPQKEMRSWKILWDIRHNKRARHLEDASHNLTNVSNGDWLEISVWELHEITSFRDLLQF